MKSRVGILYFLYLLSVALFIGYICKRYFSKPIEQWKRKSEIQDFSRDRTAAYSLALHWVGGILVMTQGIVQMSSTVRARWPIVHKWNGRLYSLMAFLTCIGAWYYMARRMCSGGISMNICFTLYGICFSGCLCAALFYIKKGNVEKHREWAIRTFSFGVASLFYRFLTLPLSLKLVSSNLLFYMNALSWMVFFPNFFIAEPYILYTRKRSLKRRSEL